MRGLSFRGFGVFAAKVPAAACLLLVALVGAVRATGDSTRGATSLAETRLSAAIAPIMGATDGNER